jgi:hypothetical protein
MQTQRARVYARDGTRSTLQGMAKRPRSRAKPEAPDAVTEPAAALELDELEERFAREYLVDGSAAAAYRRCKPDVTIGTSRAEGCKLAARPHVAARVEELRAELFARLDLKAEDVLRELMLVGFSDVGHYQVNPQTGALVVEPTEPLARRRAVQSVKHRTVISGEGESSRLEYHTELRLWDKLGALGKLGDHLKLWKQDQADLNRTEVIVDPDGTVRIVTGGQA